MSHTVGTKPLAGMDAALRSTQRELSEVPGSASVRILAAGRWGCPRRPLQVRVAAPLTWAIPAERRPVHVEPVNNGCSQQLNTLFRCRAVQGYASHTFPLKY